MGSGPSQHTTTTTAPSNPAINTALTTIGNQLNTQLGQGVKTFDQSMYPGISSETRTGANALANNPLNPAYSGALGDTMSEFGAIASGQRMGENDAAWNAARDRVVGDTNSVFNASGRFGGGSNVEAMAQGLGNVELSRLASNEARQMGAAQMLPSIYAGSALPAQMQLAGGQILDADLAASRAGEADLFDRTQNADWNTLQRGAAIAAGTAPISGTTTSGTSQQQIPWWQAGGSMLLGGLSLFG